MVDTRNPQDNLLNLAPSQNIEPGGHPDDAWFDPKKTNAFAAEGKRIERELDRKMAIRRAEKQEKTPPLPGENFTDPYEAYFDRKEAEREEQLNLAILEASKTDPDDEAAVRALAHKTGIPGYLVGRNREEIEREWKQSNIRLKQLARHNPTLASQLSDPEFAKIAWDDTPNLSNTEQLFNFFAQAEEQFAGHWRGGLISKEIGMIHFKVKNGNATPEDIKRLDELKEEEQEIGPPGFWGNVAELASIVTETTGRAVVTGTEWAGLGAAGGAAIGAIGGEGIGAVPGAIIGGIGGFTRGFLGSMLWQNFKIEAGYSYAEMKDAGVDEYTAQVLSNIVGGINSALELLEFRIAAKPLKSLKRLLTKEGVESLAKPGMAAAIMNFGRRYAGTWAGETAIEGFQEIVTMTATELARPEGESLLHTQEGRKQMAGRFWETIKNVGEGMSLLALPGPALNFYTDSKAAKNAEVERHFIEGLNSQADESKLKARSPDAYQEFIKAQANGTAVENIYIEGEVFAQVLEEHRTTPEKFDEIVPGSAEQLRETMTTGGDVVIPTEEYAAHIAGTKMGDALKPHIRVSDDSMSVNEAIQFSQVQDEMKKEAEIAFDQKKEENNQLKAEAEDIQKTLFEMIKATGRVTGEIASDYATFVRNFVTVNAGRLKMSPAEFYEKYMYKIIAPSMDTEGVKGTFNPKTLTTILYKNADYSTFVHETSHFFLHAYSDMANLPEATDSMKQDMQTILDWFGIKDLATWNAMSFDKQEKYHEQFSYNYEIYMHEGKAPSLELANIFARFGHWISTVYRTIRDELNHKYRKHYGSDLLILNDEIRSVMDRMIASEEDIAEAEAIRNIKPVFQNQEQSGMDDVTWAAYQGLFEESHNAAMTDLQIKRLKDIKWLGNARSRILRGIQKEARAKRKEIHEQVSEEVANEPVNRVRIFLRRGMIDGQPVDYPAKLSIAEIEAMYGKGEMLDSIRKKFGYGKYGLLGKKKAIHPDQVAEMFSYPSGYAMIQDLLNIRPMKEEIERRTDRRMLEENSEMIDKASIEARISEALHNEARVRFIATELRYLRKSTSPVRVINAAAKEVALEILSGRKIQTIKPGEFSRAEARAARASEKALMKGDSETAAKEKQKQLINSHLAKEALKTKQEIEKAIVFFRKIFKTDKTLAKTRNMDYVDMARAILASYGLGKKDSKKQPIDPVKYIEKFRAYNPGLYYRLEPLIDKALSGGKDWKTISLDEFRNMRDMIRALWSVARNEKKITIEDQAINLEKVTEELKRIIEERGIPTVLPGQEQAVSKKGYLFGLLTTAKAQLRRLEHWTDTMDGPMKGIDVGPFTKYIWRPVRDATTRYRTARNKYVKRYSELVAGLDLPVAKIYSPELNYTFGWNNGGIGKAELLGALLHTGNESNLRKLLLGGRGQGHAWGTLLKSGTLDTSKWNSFIQRMIDDGILTKKDFDFLQAVWDLTEEMKPIAQKTHKEIFGYYFKEIKATPFENSLGKYRGGYVPARVDRDMTSRSILDMGMDDIKEALEKDFADSVPSTGTGFTKTRVEYNRPLDLELRNMTAHIDEVLRFSHIYPAIMDVYKILKDKEFADMLNAHDPDAISSMLLPWLKRTALQQTSTMSGWPELDKTLTWIRQNTGLAIMFANIRNALQQLTGFFPAAIRVKGRYLKSANWDYIKAPGKTAQEISELSEFMKDRMENQIFDVQGTLNEILLNPKLFGKLQQWSKKNGYFLQRAFQNYVDIVTWKATYNQVLAEMGAKESDSAVLKEAVKRADANVRLTQDSLSPEDLARFQTGTPFAKLFTQFSNFFNMLGNLVGGEMTKAGKSRELSQSEKNKRRAWVFLMGIAMPAIISELIIKTTGGGWDGDDEDGYIDDLVDVFLLSQVKFIAPMAPVVGSSVMGLFETQGRAGVSNPVISTIGRISRTISSPQKIKGWKIKDIFTALTLATGIPFTPAGNIAGYAWDVESGAVEPKGPIDYTRGIITGKAAAGTRK